MKAISAVTLLIGTMSVVVAEAGVFEDKIDRFTGVRSVSWNAIPSQAESFAVSTAALYSKGSAAPNQYLFQIITYSSSSQFDKCPYVEWLIDGEPGTGLQTKYSRDGAGSTTIERFALRPTRETLFNLASAKLVEFKVCNVESSISPGDMDGLRKVLEATK